MADRVPVYVIHDRTSVFTTELFNLSTALVDLYTKTNNRCINTTLWNYGAQLKWVTDLIELQHKVQFSKILKNN